MFTHLNIYILISSGLRGEEEEKETDLCTQTKMSKGHIPQPGTLGPEEQNVGECRRP